MECGGDWKHLAPLRYVRMNDGMGVYGGGPDREVWEGEALLAAITLSLWEVEVCSPPCVLFSRVNLCLFVYLGLVPLLSAFAILFFLTFLVVVFLTFFFHSSALCVYVSPAVCSLWRLLITLLTLASKGANKKVKMQFYLVSCSFPQPLNL